MKKLTMMLIALICIIQIQGQACTRVSYEGPNNTVLTARSMDWKSDLKTNLWVLPAGMQRDGAVGANSLRWTSKYGSVIATAYDICTTDGMNEKGLVANLLWLAESEYPKFDQKTPGLSIAMWTQYVLDNFGTVDEAVNELGKESFVVVTANMPGQKDMANLHLAISDASGDNAVFEYIGGKLSIHHSHSFRVMTNSPIYEKQIALAEYWNQIGGTSMLPGTNRAADRFARASFYINAIPKTDNLDIALAGVFSVIRNCSVPFGISTPNQPNISSTWWRSVSDHKNKRYYFETSMQLSVFWIDFASVNLSQSGEVLKLEVAELKNFAGNANAELKRAPMFEFAGIK